MQKSVPLILAFTVTLLAGCDTRFPSVQYEQVKTGTRPDLDGNVGFNLPKTILMLDQDKDKKLILQAVPGESDSNLFQIIPNDPWLIKTSFKWIKRENTNLLQSVGTEVEDNRVKTIQAVGATLATVVTSGLIPFQQISQSITLPRLDIDELGDQGKPEKAKLKLPLAIDTEPFLAGYKGGALSDTADNGTAKNQGGKVGFKIEFGPLSLEAIPLDNYLSAIKGKTQHAIFIPACRTAKLTFTDTDSELAGMEFSTTIADPNYVRTIGFPNKGVVNMHSVCGANVLGEKAEISTNSEVVNALMAQAKSLSETWKTERKKQEDARKAAKQ